MNKDQILERLEKIEKSLQHCVANYNSLIGQRAECEHWLKMLDGANKSESVLTDELSNI